jgi:hypothetical protein
MGTFSHAYGFDMTGNPCNLSLGLPGDMEDLRIDS